MNHNGHNNPRNSHPIKARPRRPQPTQKHTGGAAVPSQGTYGSIGIRARIFPPISQAAEDGSAGSPPFAAFS